MNVETQLRETLLGAADDIGSVGPAAAVGSDSMRARARSQRRRRAAILSAGLAVLLIAVAVPSVLSRVSSQDDRVVDPPTLPFGDIYDVPTRGSLATDGYFIEAVRQLSWVSPAAVSDPPLPDAPVETRHVVFAGDVAEGRWALVVGENTAQPRGAGADPDLQTDLGALSDIAAVWFVGPPGATPEQMQLVTIPRGISADQPASLYNGSTGALVVISALGDVIEISPRPEVAADATVTRSYADAGTADGLAVTTVEPTPFAAYGPPAVQFRVSRAGVVVAEQQPDGYGDPAGVVVPSVALSYVRPSVEALPVGAPTDQEQQLAQEIVGEYGLLPEELDLQVHYDGPIPGGGEGPAVLTLVTATFPSGAVITRANWLEEIVISNSPRGGDVFGGSSCTDELSPAGLPAVQRIVAMRCEVGAGDGSGQRPEVETTLVIVAPLNLADGFASVTVGSETSTFDLADGGVAMIPFPEGATSVVIAGVDGGFIDEVPILTE